MGQVNNCGKRNLCTIVCGAPCQVPQGEQFEGYVIAADRGLDHCLKAGVIPDLVVGDFDSANSKIPDGVECLRFPPQKDDTDSAIAAKTAVGRGYNELRFLCALGGRFSHSFANIQLAYSLKKQDIRAALFGDGQKAFLLQNESVKLPKFDGYLSVFAFGETAVVTLRGVKYPVEKYGFTDSFPLGVSNEITAEFAEITVHSGTALIIQEFE